MPEPTVSHCAAWLRDFLIPHQAPSGGFGDADFEVATVLRAAKQYGYSRRLVRAAKNRLQLVVTSREDNGRRRFYWRLP